jgi:transcriptional regulator with XRE-family HTH domain
MADHSLARVEMRDLSQGDIETPTGLLRICISRVENGHTVPTIETLEKFARALEVPMYQLCYEGEKPPVLELAKTRDDGWGVLAVTLGRSTDFAS